MGGRNVAVVVAAVALSAALALGETLRPGEVRTAAGRVSAVDLVHRTVVLEMATPKGDLTVGVTLRESVEPTAGGRPVALSAVTVGDQAVLRYTREDGRLVGLELQLRR